MIIDNTNTTEAEFEPYVSMATACGYSVGFREPSSPWWLDARKSLMSERCPLEIDRHATTMAAKCSHGVPAHVIANMLCRYQVI